MGIIIGGAGFLLMQAVAYPMEGKPERVKKDVLHLGKEKENTKQ